MKQVSLHSLGTSEDEIESVRAPLSQTLDTDDIALVHYRPGPEDSFPGGLHAHADQAEIFLVQRGTSTFETITATDRTAPPEDGTVLSTEATETAEITVEAGEIVRFAPGEFQSGRNTGDEAVVAVAIGVPRETDDVRFPQACPDCGHPDVRLDTDDGAVRFVCPACAAEHVPRGCPECHREELAFTLDGSSGVVAACDDCGATVRDAINF